MGQIYRLGENQLSKLKKKRKEKEDEKIEPDLWAAELRSGCLSPVGPAFHPNFFSGFMHQVVVVLSDLTPNSFPLIRAILSLRGMITSSVLFSPYMSLPASC